MTTTTTTARRATTARPKPRPDAERPVARITPKNLPDLPESLALVLMEAALNQTPQQRREMLDLYAECLQAVCGNRRPATVAVH